MIEKNCGNIKSYFIKYKEYYPEYIKKLEHRYKNNRVLAFLFYPFLYKSNLKEVQYIFAGNASYFSDLAITLNGSDVLFLETGLRSHIKKILKNNESIFSFGLYLNLHKYINDESVGEECIMGEMETLAKLLKATRAKYLFIQSDSMPYERLIISAARMANIFTVCVQHGIFNNNTPQAIIEGRYADAFFAYDQHQAKIVGNINSVVVGSFFKNANRYKFQKKKVVCFFGQPYPILFPKIAELYLSVVDRIRLAANKYSIDFFYKPHPGEINSQYLKRIEGVIFNDTEECYENFDYFMAFSSTTLHQASLRGKVAIQIIDDNIHTDDYSIYGYCHSIKINNLNNLLKNIDDILPIESDALSIFNNGNLLSRWNSAIDKLNNLRDI